MSVPATPDHDAPRAYRARFDALIVRCRDIANAESTGMPTRRILLEVVDELASLRRGLAALNGAPLAALPAPPPRRKSSETRAGVQMIRGRASRPPDGKRWCANHDAGEGAFLSIDKFHVKDVATGKRASWCDDCRRGYQRERYVSIRAKTMTVELIEGDRCVGHDCPICGLPFEIGEKVRGENLIHETCAP